MVNKTRALLLCVKQNERIHKADISSIPLTRISWEPDVTEKLETWIRQTAGGNYKDYTPDIETYFEKKLNKPCIAVSSGTAALHLAIQQLKLAPGSEVIMPTLTYAACANAVLYEKLSTVFCDVNAQTWCLDATILKNVFDERLKAGANVGVVMPVHSYGQASPMNEIRQICDSYGVPIIEDVAQALGGKYEGSGLGSLGRYACFSFNANKTLTGMGGGLLALESEEEKLHIRNLSRHGRLPFENGLAHYIHQEIGYNYQMSGYSAALIHLQLPHLRERLERKLEIFENYSEALLTKVPLKPQSGINAKNHTRWLSCFQLLDESACESKRDELCRYLSKNGIEARPVFKLLHQQPAYLDHTRADCEHAEHIANSGICLPSPCDLTEKEQQRVIKTIKNWFVRQGSS